MQNRTAIWVFTVLLTLTCLYQISFTFVTSSVESGAAKAADAKIDSLNLIVQSTGNDFVVMGSDTLPYANEKDVENVRSMYEQKLLDAKAKESVYPIFGYTYGFCKKNELSLGLDLQGGMAVTLELSVPDLVNTLSDYSSNLGFRKAMEKASQEAGTDNEKFLDEFLAAANSEDVQLGRIFSQAGDDSDEFTRKMSNAEVLQKLREMAEKAITNTEDIIKTRIDKFGVAQPNISKEASTGRIMIELPGVKNKDRVRSQLQATANLEFWEAYNLGELDLYLEELNVSISEYYYPNVRDSVQLAIESNIKEANEKKEEKKEASTREIDTIVMDTSYITVDSLPGDSQMVVTPDTTFKAPELSAPSLDNTASAGLDSSYDRYADVQSFSDLPDDIKKKISPIWSRVAKNVVEQNGRQYWRKGCVIGSCKISDTSAINRYLKHPVVESILPQDLRLMWSAKPILNDDRQETEWLELYALKADEEGRAAMTGEVVDNASWDFNQNTGQVEVILVMNDAGTTQWADLTSNHIGDQVAITLDNHVYSAPVINDAINNGRTSISGTFTRDEGADLATLLNSGSLPAKLRIVEESVVGPSLGKDNIQSGLISFIAALLVVLVYMIFYYGKAGAVADVALIANIFFLVGTLASLGAALTLSGIAGIVLTIGMSVDANVLIFERIREELRAGKGMKLAISDGYKKAYAAIVDANLTTLLTAIVLSVFGSGTIQGFATTLIIGIFTSLFSAIFITRLIFSTMMDKKRAVAFGSKLTNNAFTKVNVGWLGKRKIYYAISGLIIAGGIGSLATTGLDYGVEFEGGNMYVLQYSDEVDLEAVKKELGDQFVEDGNKMTPEVKQKGDSFTAQIVTKYLASSSADNVQEQIKEKIAAGMETLGYKEYPSVEVMNSADTPGYVEIESRQVDQQISDELMIESLFAIFFALIVIFLYIVFRFRKWQFGLGALVAMFHDVLLVLGLFSILYKMMPFTMEINQAFIAAILTVVGYSINDTVVVFDRIREYLGLYKRKTSEEVVNSALNSTLSRTINTSLSTFVVLLVIFLFGGEAIRGFVFALMIGVVVGTYSSLCIATPLAYDLSKRKLTVGDQTED